MLKSPDLGSIKLLPGAVKIKAEPEVTAVTASVSIPTVTLIKTEPSVTECYSSCTYYYSSPLCEKSIEHSPEKKTDLIQDEKKVKALSILNPSVRRKRGKKDILDFSVRRKSLRLAYKNANKFAKQATESKDYRSTFNTKKNISNQVGSEVKENALELDIKFLLSSHTNVSVPIKERPHSCTVCGKKFQQAVNLEIHMRIHNGEKPYSCIACTKKFRQLSQIKAHMRLHTGEKPYQCSVCKKWFRQVSQINAHMRLHTGEKPYRCKSCGASFTQLCSLNYHKQKIHDGT